MCRWALGVGYPSKVTSAGGRYHFDDDWEFPDTQVATFDFENGETISWEGMSCNGRPTENRGRGAAIHGTQGTAVIDRSGYVVYDLENHEVVRRLRGETADALDIRGEGVLTDQHVANFLDAIRGSATPAAPIDEGHKSQLLCHLGNIAQRTGHALHCDPQTGRIVNDAEAAALWARVLDVHAKDLKDLVVAESQCVAGEGAIPIPAIFRQLVAMGYAGCVNLEYEIDARDPLPGMQRSFAYMRGALAGLGVTEG